MSEPMTEAGRAYSGCDAMGHTGANGHWRNPNCLAIGAIEAEAVAQERERLRVAEVERVEMLRRLLERARLVSQWHDSIGSGPIEELNAELGELGDLCRWHAALIQSRCSDDPPR